MRHVVSLVIGLVTAPLVWLLVGFGQLLLFNVVRRFAQGDVLQLTGPLALLVGPTLTSHSGRTRASSVTTTPSGQPACHGPARLPRHPIPAHDRSACRVSAG